MTPGANRYRARSYTATMPQPQPAPLLRVLAILGAGLTALVLVAVLAYGIQLARAPRPVPQPTAAPAPQAVQPATLSQSAVAPTAADTIDGMSLDAFWARYQTATAWHVVAHTDDGWVYFCDGARNGGTYWRGCAGPGHCDDTLCSFPTQAAVEDFYNRLLTEYHVEGAAVLNPLGWTPPPAPLGARSGWNGQRALPPGDVK